jgi:hypothetical protein
VNAHSFLLKSPDGDLAIFFETDGVQVNGMHIGKASVFKVRTFQAVPGMPGGALYTETCDELLSFEGPQTSHNKTTDMEI